MMQKKLNLFPISYRSQASHLLLQSGLTSSAKNVNRSEVEQKIHDLNNSIAFCCDIFEVIPENDSWWAEQIDLSSVSLTLDFYEIQKHQQGLTKILEKGLTLYVMVHRDMKAEEIELFSDLSQKFQNIFILYVESKLFAFTHFWQNTPEKFRDQIFCIYLPKLNNWDALLSPLESLESLNKKRSTHSETPLLILYNDSMQDLGFSEKAFYLNPSKEEYVRLFSRSLPHFLARQKIFHTLKNSVALFYLAKLLRWILSPQESYRQANISWRLVWQKFKFNLWRRPYWLGFHFFAEARVSLIKTGWILRNGFIRILWLMRDFARKTFWFFYGFRGSSKVRVIRLAWAIRNSSVALYWFFYGFRGSSKVRVIRLAWAIRNSSVALCWFFYRAAGLLKVLAVRLYWKIKSFPAVVLWRTRSLMSYVFWRIYHLGSVLFWGVRHALLVTLWRIRSFGNLLFWNGRGMVFKVILLIKHSLLFYPFYKTYCFLEYQFHKRILRETENES